MSGVNYGKLFVCLHQDTLPVLLVCLKSSSALVFLLRLLKTDNILHHGCEPLLVKKKKGKLKRLCRCKNHKREYINGTIYLYSRKDTVLSAST